MANRRRGEVDAVVDGRPVVLCLTLGALAALEAAYAAEDLAALAERFATGRLSARDVARVFASGLSGGGRPTTEDDVMAMRIDGGLVAAAGVVADLLAVTFGGEADAPSLPPHRSPDPRESVDVPAPASAGGAAGSAGPALRPPPVPGADEPPSPGTR